MNLYFLSFSRYKANHLISLNVCSMLFPLITFVLICPYLTMEVIRKTPTTKDLIMLFILCRHGDRSPVHTFPVDPYRNVWKMGYGQLTAYGAEQHHELGRLIRKMYSGFLPEIYHKDEVLFRSSGTERTLMSANNFIRGFYQLEKKSTNQLPPVFSRLTHEDHLLKMSSKCPKFKKLFHHLMNSSAVSRKASTFKDFFSYLEQVSGYAFPKEKDSPENFYPAWHICDPITIWVNHAFSSLPQWVTDDVYKKCTSLLDYKHFIRFSRPQLTRLRGGPLAGHLVDLFRERINKEAKQNDNNNAHENPSEKRSRRFVAYFAHDSTLAALLSHLGVYNGLKPPLASCLIVELHRPSLSFKDFHVVFHYLNETKLPFNTEKLINLWPPHCGTLNTINGQPDYSCSFTKFQSSVQGTYATDVSTECYEDNASTDRTTLPKIKPTGIRIFESYCYYPQLLTVILFQTAVVCYFLVRFLPIPVVYITNSLRHLR